MSGYQESRDEAVRALDAAFDAKLGSPLLSMPPYFYLAEAAVHANLAVAAATWALAQAVLTDDDALSDHVLPHTH